MVKKLNTGFTLDNCLFGSAKLTKNADPDKYKYSSYGVGFDLHSEFYYLMEASEEMSLFLELIWAQLCMLMIKTKIS